MTVFFLDLKLKESYEKLKSSKFEDKKLYSYISRAIHDISNNHECGIHINRRLIPQIYKKNNIDNLWKYDLPNGWRLLYTIDRDDTILISIILEWMDHKNYERRFKY